MEMKEHPLNEILKQFDKVFFSQYSKDIEKGIRSGETNLYFKPKIVSEV